MKKVLTVLLFLLACMGYTAFADGTRAYDFTEGLPDTALVYLSNADVNNTDSAGNAALSITAKTQSAAPASSRYAFDVIEMQNELCADMVFSYSTAGNGFVPDKFIKLVNADSVSSNPSTAFNLIRIKGDELMIGQKSITALESGKKYNLKLRFNAAEKSLALWLDGVLLTDSPEAVSVSDAVMKKFDFSKTRIMLTNGYPSAAGESVLNVYYISMSPSAQLDISTVPANGAEFIPAAAAEKISVDFGSLVFGTPEVTLKCYDLNGGNETEVGFDMRFLGMMLNVIPDEISELKNYVLSVSGLTSAEGENAYIQISFTTADEGYIVTAIEIIPDRTEVREGGSVKFTANITGSSQISKTEWYVNGALEQTIESAPYDYEFSASQKGTYKIYAVAYNAIGISAQSETVTAEVTENKKPEVAFECGNIEDIDSFNEITVSAYDPDGSIDTVLLYIDGKLSAQQNGDLGRYTFAVDIKSSGEHTIEAAAVDNDGCKVSVKRTVKLVKFSSNEILNLDFNTYTGNSIPFQKGAAYNSAGNETTSYGALKIDDEHGISFATGVTKQSNGTTAGPWVAVYATTSGIMYLDFELYMTADDMTLIMTNADRSGAAAVSQQLINVDKGFLKLYDVTGQVENIRLQKETWYKFNYIFNVLENTFSLTVSDGADTVVQRENLTVAKPVKRFDDIRFNFGGGVDGTFCIDNVYCRTEDIYPYITAVKSDGEDYDGLIDYNAASLNVTLSSGLKSIAQGDVVLENEIGEVKIKSVALSGNELLITPDYMENRGFEPSNTYRITISENAVTDNSEPLGRKTELVFKTTSKAVDVTDASLETNGKAQFTAQVKNDTSADKKVTAVVMIYKNGVFDRLKMTVATVNAGSALSISADAGNCNIGDAVKAYVIDESLRPVSNKIYISVCK